MNGQLNGIPCNGLVSCGCGDGEEGASSTRAREDCETCVLKFGFDRLFLLKERMCLEDIEMEESEREPRKDLASDESRPLALSIILMG